MATLAYKNEQNYKMGLEMFNIFSIFRIEGMNEREAVNAIH